MSQLTPSPTPSNPTSTSSTSTSSPRSTRRRGLSYLRTSTLHRLSSLGNSDSPAPATTSSNNQGGLHQLACSAPQPTASAPHQTHSTDPSDEPLLPPNPLHDQSHPAPHTQAIPGDGATAAVVNTAIGGISRIMARHRLTRSISETVPPSSMSDKMDKNGSSNELPSIRLVPHQDPRSNRPSLVFPPMSRTLPSEDSIIRVGRYSERDAAPNPPPNLPSAAPVGFKSKVVSRKHCEFWCSNGQWFIKDVKSSSGTFLNHIRLSQPSVESRPFPIKDGDVVQLGIDFRGGEEMIFRCVKIRVECNRGWQKALNTFKYAMVTLSKFGYPLTASQCCDP